MNTNALLIILCLCALTITGWAQNFQSLQHSNQLQQQLQHYENATYYHGGPNQ